MLQATLPKGSDIEAVTGRMGRVNQADGRVVKDKRGQHHSGTVRGSGKLGHDVAEARLGATEMSRWQGMKSPIILVTEVGFYPLCSKNHKKQCFSHCRISSVS